MTERFHGYLSCLGFLASRLLSHVSGGPPLCGPCGPVLTASGLPTESLLSHPLSVEACGTGSQPGQPRDPSPK